MHKFFAGVFGLLLVSIFQLSGQRIGGAKVHVAIFYEALCPDSMLFISNQLLPQYSYFADSINLQFVPFGKSSSLQTGSSIDFTCQHGPDECRGNKIQSCALDLIRNNQDSQVQFVSCQMQYGAHPSGQVCSNYVNIPFAEVAHCETDGLGTQLQLEAETDTKTVAHPRYQLSFVPTIVYNYEFNQSKQDRSQYDFQGVLCEEFKLIGAVSPSICGQRG